MISIFNILKKELGRYGKVTVENGAYYFEKRDGGLAKITIVDIVNYNGSIHIGFQIDLNGGYDFFSFNANNEKEGKRLIDFILDVVEKSKPKIA